LNNLSKNRVPRKTQPTEFDGILQLPSADHTTIDEMECDAKPTVYAREWQKIRDLLEQKATLAMEPYVLAVLEENKADLDSQYRNIGQINSILQKIASQMSAQATCYFRAGKAYMRVNHEMGDVGNLFFKSLLNNVLKNFGENYHMQTQENSVCAICRI
jgi:hypothetical protein